MVKKESHAWLFNVTTVHLFNVASIYSNLLEQKKA